MDRQLPALRVTAIGGVPASGKTTLMRAVLDKVTKSGVIGIRTKHGKCWVTEFPELRLSVLGIYDNGVFDGTDKLSMAVQPDALDYLNDLARRYRETWSAMFEGDRLFNDSFLTSLQDCKFRLDVVILEVDSETQAARFKARGSNQNPTFLKGRETKIKRLKEKWMNTDNFRVASLKTERSAIRLAASLLEWNSKN